MNLGFANPALLWGLLAAAIPLAIHLFFRRRPRPTPFPAIEFILKARRETQRRLRLRKILLFSARTLLLAAIAAAIARPHAQAPQAAAAAVAQGPRATALVLDASGSMRYTLGGRRLFDRARADLLDALAALSPEDPVTVLVCGSAPPAAAPPSFDRAAARALLEHASAEAGHSDLTVCSHAAIRALLSAGAQQAMPKRLVIATDLAASAWRLDVPSPTVDTPRGAARPEVEVLDAARGEPLPNHAVVGLEVEPDPAAGPRGYRFTVTLANQGPEKVTDVPLQLVVGRGPEAKVAIRAFTELPAGGTVRKTLLHGFGAGGPAEVQLVLPGDALPMDDTRGVALQVPRDVKALVVDGAPSPIKFRDEAYFVEAALASPASPVRPHLVDAEAFAKEDLAAYDVVFLLNVRNAGARAADLQRFVENGGGLFVSLGDQVDPEVYSRELGALLPMALHVEKSAGASGGGATGTAHPARFAEVDWNHPALSVFTGDAREGLLGTRVFRYVLARPATKGGTAPPHVLAAFDDGAPALVEARRGKGRVLLFTSTADRDWTDWPIRTSFLPAMQRFAGFLVGALDERRVVPTVVGERRALRLGDGQALAGLVDPSGRAWSRADLERSGLEDEPDGSTYSWAPPEPGLWQVRVKVKGEEKVDPQLTFAVWTDPRESDTRRLEPSELTAWFGGEGHAKVAGDARAAAGRKVPLWSMLLVAGLLAFLAEGVLLAPRA